MCDKSLIWSENDDVGVSRGVTPNDTYVHYINQNTNVIINI